MTQHLRSQGKNVKRGRKGATEAADPQGRASLDEGGQAESDLHADGAGDFEEELDEDQGLYEE